MIAGDGFCRLTHVGQPIRGNSSRHFTPSEAKTRSTVPPNSVIIRIVLFNGVEEVGWAAIALCIMQ
jgi:hypothetical protein